MASHRRNRSTPDAASPSSQSIPLQDFGLGNSHSQHLDVEGATAAGGDVEAGAGGNSDFSHRRTLSDRGRSLFRRNRESLLNRSPRVYTKIGEDDDASPSPPSNSNSNGNSGNKARGRGISPTLRIITPSGQQARVDDGDDDEDTAAASVAPAYHDDAMGGFSGLSFDASQLALSLHGGRLGGRGRGSLSTMRTTNSTNGDELIDDNEDDPTDYFPHEADNDTLPLTDSSHLQPTTSLNPPSTPSPNRNDRGRGSFQSVRFLGDDLHDPEPGTLSPDGARGRSLSPSSAESPLHRATSMMRKMSQRVVNLSNEADLVERDIRRKSSLGHASSRHHLSPINTNISEFATADGATSLKSPVSEKMPSPILRPADEQGFERPPPDLNPLKGKSLGIFPPDSKIRLKLMDLLLQPFTEPFILVLIILQTILLLIDSRQSVFTHPRSPAWGTGWIDFALLALFTVYTIEIIIRVIVSGFVINPVEYSTINRQIGLRAAVSKKANEMFALHRKPSMKHTDPAFTVSQSGLIRTLTRAETFGEGPGTTLQAQKTRLAHRAFLRHSFNRLDFVAVVSFWISFFIAVFGIQANRHVYVFRMLSCLRILRLLGITSGTSVILRSLKKAAPSLLNVAFLTCFFWLLFAIIGLQSFKSSFRRTCVWLDPTGNSTNDYVNDFVFCGGQLQGTLQNYTETPWVHSDMSPGTTTHKGYLCPVGSMCIEGQNPYNGTVNFDNLVQSLELVFVIMTSNTFSDLLYYTTNSDYLASAIFFACGIIIFPLWLINLLIAVITSSFQVIRDESKASAFTAHEHAALSDMLDKDRPKYKISKLKQWYDKTELVWILVITYGLLAQCFRSDTMSPERESFIDASELGVTILLLVEIILRFVAGWRNFFYSKRNCVDLALAIVTAVIQIPPIKNSGQVYSWLTVFQILRIYRVVLAVDLTRDLIMTVLGNFSGLANLILFVFLLCLLGAIFATQIFRGELPMQSDSGDTLEVSFFSIWNSFLGMYQIFSSENWTDILYDVTSYNVMWDTGWIGAAFCILWFILANFIVLNMFIAVIQENFDVSEDEKRLQQVKAFLSSRDYGSGGAGQGTLSLSTIFKFGQVRRQDPLDYGSAAAEMLLKDAVVRDFLDDETGEPASPPDSAGLPQNQRTTVKAGIIANLWEKMIDRIFNREPNPFYSRLEFSRAHEELDPRQMAREVVLAADRRKKAQREYLRTHPKYNVSLYIFPIDNPIRRMCQRMVGPGRGGDRIEGVMPNRPVWYTFSAFIYAAIVAMVLLACVTTPLYQKEYFTVHGFSVQNWFVYTDMGFAALFTVESVIRVIADGFFWTPNAYYRGSWGFIDGVVLLTLWANIIALLYDPGGGSRAVGAFKALRALRLLNVSDSARDTFHSVIVMGGWKVLSAAFVSLSLLIPFAIYGLNLFNGRMMSCNDTDSGIFNLTDCTGEYLSSPYNWDVLAPRQVANSYYDFDNFGSALFILFQIVSQEGWIDVMWSAQSITGLFTQPGDFVSQGNAIYFVIFNLLGAVFVLTLFVSVFMRNYTEQTGVAFLTTDQRSWLELRKLLKQISPSKRSSKKEYERAKWKQWCYRLAVQKTGRWQKAVTSVLVFHLILLCLEWYPSHTLWLDLRNWMFFMLCFFYIANIVIRIVGLSWARFRRSLWDLYSLASVCGTFVTSILLFTNKSSPDYIQLNKLFLVSISLLLIPRNNQLDQLFKTAAASVTQISNLLATWFVLFLVYAIAFTQTFGLTRFGDNEDGNANFRTVPKALIFLFRISSGEGWNQLMVDFEEIVPPYCTVSDNYYDGDCGSSAWARALFVSWNILSMYIFMNLFISLIYESFSYVYQRSSGLSVISREEIRRFKQAWSEFDPAGTGYITKDKFPRLLGELSGVFEMRIYDGDFTVNNILQDILPKAPSRSLTFAFDGSSLHESSHHGMKRPINTPIDLDALNTRMSEIPIDEIRRRRIRMNTFYEEVLVTADPDRGIEFTSLLMVLAHYKVINDNKSLRLEEFLRRRARLQRVEEAVRRNVVVGFFDTLYWSRRFRRELARKKREREDLMSTGRLQGIPQLDVPEIFVHDESDNDNSTINNNNEDDAGSRSRSRSADPSHNYFAGSDRDNSVPATPVDKEGPLSNLWTDIPISPSSAKASSNPGSIAGSTEFIGGGSNSIQATPSTSPTRQRFARGDSSRSTASHYQITSPVEIPADWQFANALIGHGTSANIGIDITDAGRRSPSPTPGGSPHTSQNFGMGASLTLPPPAPAMSFDHAFAENAASGDGTGDLGSSSGLGGLFSGRRGRAGTLSAATPSPFSSPHPSPGLDPMTAAVARSRAGTLSVPGGDIFTLGGGSDGGGSSVSGGARSRAASSVATSARDLVLGELENSAWGESIRRSFTTAKPTRSGRMSGGTGGEGRDANTGAGAVEGAADAEATGGTVGTRRSGSRSPSPAFGG